MRTRTARPLRPILAAAWTLALSVLAGAALAEPPRGFGGPPGPPHGGPPEERRLERLVDRLGLDAETEAAVQEVLDEAHERRREVGPRLREAHERMRALMEATEPDEEAILAQADALGALELEARKHRIRTLLRVRELLPPEARDRLVELMKTHGPRHRRHFENGITGRRDRDARRW